MRSQLGARVDFRVLPGYDLGCAFAGLGATVTSHPRSGEFRVTLRGFEGELPVNIKRCFLVNARMEAWFDDLVSRPCAYRWRIPSSDDKLKETDRSAINGGIGIYLTQVPATCRCGRGPLGSPAHTHTHTLSLTVLITYHS